MPRLRDVLRGSADAEHRALAALVIAYADDKRAVVQDLVEAVGDPSSTVRNNAMRALGVMAAFARRRPELGIRVPTAPFIDMLNSLVWTDRNKSSHALAQLTATRDSALLGELRARALPALVDIARWKSPGHAHDGLLILGRIAGWPEERIWQAIQGGEREAIVAAAHGTR
jgi:HEAT repeat protein